MIFCYSCVYERFVPFANGIYFLLSFHFTCSAYLCHTHTHKMRKPNTQSSSFRNRHRKIWIKECRIANDDNVEKRNSARNSIRYVVIFVPAIALTFSHKSTCVKCIFDRNLHTNEASSSHTIFIRYLFSAHCLVL